MLTAEPNSCNHISELKKKMTVLQTVREHKMFFSSKIKLYHSSFYCHLTWLLLLLLDWGLGFFWVFFSSNLW